MKRTVSLLLLASSLSIILISSGCSKPRTEEPAKVEQTQPITEVPATVEVPAEETPAPEAIAEQTPEAQAGK